MAKMSDEQQRYLKMLEDWKTCKTNTPFKDYVMAAGYSEQQYKEMMRKFK